MQIGHAENRKAVRVEEEQERGRCKDCTGQPVSKEPKDHSVSLENRKESPCSRPEEKAVNCDHLVQDARGLCPSSQVGDCTEHEIDCPNGSFPTHEAPDTVKKMGNNVARKVKASEAPASTAPHDENRGLACVNERSKPSLKLPVASITERARKQLLASSSSQTCLKDTEEMCTRHAQIPVQQQLNDRLDDDGMVRDPDIPNIFASEEFLTSFAQDSSDHDSMDNDGSSSIERVSNESKDHLPCTVGQEELNANKDATELGAIKVSESTIQPSVLQDECAFGRQEAGTAVESLPESGQLQEDCAADDPEVVECSSLPDGQQLEASKGEADNREDSWEVDLESLPDRLAQVPSPTVASMDFKKNFDSDPCRSEDLSVGRYATLQTVSEGSDSMLEELERMKEQGVHQEISTALTQADEAPPSHFDAMSGLLAFEQEVELLSKLQELLEIRIRNPQLQSGASTKNQSENVLDLLHLRATGQAVQWRNCDLPVKKACLLPGGEELRTGKSTFSCVPGKSQAMCAASLGARLMGWKESTRRLTTACTLTRRRMAQTVPISYSYTHSSARGVEREQKLLDVRFRPDAGDGPSTQLVVSANKSPSELVMYNLEDGTRKDLAAPNGSAIQDVIYARKGALIVSAGASNGMVHVWDSYLGELLHTFGPECEVLGTPGHQKEVGQLALLEDSTFNGRCLLATHGCSATDRHILLWDLVQGRYLHSVNGGDASRQLNAMASIGMDVVVGLGRHVNREMARAEVWDTEASAMKFSVEMPGRNIDVVHGCTVGGTTLFLTGCETGTTHIFDMRNHSGSLIFSTEPSKTEAEATSASFSHCGRFMQTSSSSNLTLVYDLRYFKEPLHRLDHGKPAKTIDPDVDPGVVSVRANTVDKGDEGVNSAHWLHNSPCLLTGCGNGIVALWDTSLGVPCVWYKGPQNGGLHHRSVNGVAVSQDDCMFASCSDEQKVVLYGPSSMREERRLTNLQEIWPCQ
mmetsp:Transcript_4793/g.30388  ORF Transcript_4793/g.30388 Transcript_4793/m.30388 type:complete len:981 (+) Transcript_4793:897-3839(+)